MKTQKLSFIFRVILLPLFFAPFFFIEGNAISLAFAAKNYAKTILFALFLLNIAFYFLYLISVFINKNQKVKSAIAIFSSFFGLISLGVMLYGIFEIFGDNAPLTIGPGYVCCSFLFLFNFFEACRAVNTAYSFSIRDMAEIAVCLAMAIILDMPFCKIRIGQNGGSISLTMLPLFLISYRKGFFKGFITTGIMFGMIDCLIDGYGLVTFPFDYFLGFGSIAIAGLFSKIFKIKSTKALPLVIVSLLISLTSRCLAATLSGMLFYGLDFVPSLIYQLSYIVPSGLLVSMILIIIRRPILAIWKRF